MEKTRVFIFDRQPFFRRGVSQWLDEQKCFSCCGEADSMASARMGIARLMPEVLLLEIRLDDGDGVEFAREISRDHASLRFIVLSQASEAVYAHRALRAGARGFVMKSEPPETLAAALEAVVRGEVYLGRATSARILNNLFPDPVSKCRSLSLLSDRELEVFQMLGSGCRPRDIASTLHISKKTIDSHRLHIKDKLALDDGAALVRAATIWVKTGEYSTEESGSGVGFCGSWA